MTKANGQGRQRPNAWLNRYNQWVLAGRIAERLGHMGPEIASASGPARDSVYRANGGGVHYSMVGQAWLRALGLPITELARQ